MARLQAQLAQGIDQYCDAVLDKDGGERHTLSIKTLQSVDEDLAGFVLRRALKRAALEPPSERQVREILSRLVPARIDAMPLVSWGQNEVRRFGDQLYFLRGLVPVSKIGRAHV